MKVYIGPYRNRWISNIHTKYMNNKYGYYEWDGNHNLFEKFLEKLEGGLQSVYNATINQILDKLSSQKIKVHIDHYDVWGMDDTLAHIVTPMLKLLKEKKHGSAYVENEDVPEHLRHPVTDDPDHDSTIHERWSWVLGEMIWAFEQKSRLDGWEADYYEFEPDSNKTLGLKYSKRDHEGAKKHQQRMSNGFRLFGKYYEGLWD